MALDGFSLACNVFQAISFTREVVLQVKDIYKYGQSDYDEQLINDKIDRLTKLRNDFGELTGAGISNVPGKDNDLLPLAQACLKATKEFRARIDNINLCSGKGSTFGAIGARIRMARNQRKISKLEKSMERHEKLLDSAIFRELLSKTNAIYLQRSTDFAELDGQVQSLIGLVADGQNDVRHLYETYISKDNTSKEQKKVASFEKLLQSVYSNFANQRKIEVARAHDATFKWIFHPGGRQRWDDSKNPFKLKHTVYEEIRAENGAEDTSEENAGEIFEDSDEEGDEEGDEESYDGIYDNSYDESHDGSHEESDEESDEENGAEDGVEDGAESGEEFTPENHACSEDRDPHMSCFLCWLKTPLPEPYWVCGKPGSGKSTFMKYIAESTKTRSALKSIYGDDVLILSHFIYRHGHADQRSSRGAMLSLLHQYLNSVSEDAIKVQLVDAIACHTQLEVSQKHSPSDWSHEELETALLFLLQNSHQKLLIFIDGLDEIGDEQLYGSQLPVLRLVNKLCETPGVRMCISSRPESMFEEKFRSNPRLTLQNLTGLDILTFVADTLRPYYDKDRSRRKFLAGLAKQLWLQSDGVFLWACIVVKDLVRRLGNGDDDGMVENRLKRLPKDMFALYKAMLGRSEDNEEDDYREFASECLHTVRYWQDRKMKFVDESHTRNCPITNIMPLQEVKDMLERLIAHPTDICTWARKRLGDLSRSMPIRTSYLLEVTSVNHYVGFIHRSAADFLDTAEGRCLLQDCQLDGEALDAKVFWCLLLPIAMQHNLHDFLHHLAVFIWRLEVKILESHPQLAISLLYTCQRLYYSRMPSDLPASLASPEYFLPHASFNLMLVRASSPTLLLYAMTCDIGNLKLPDDISQDTRFSKPQLPMVYSQEYLYFLIYQSVMVRSFGYGLYRGWNMSDDYKTMLGYGRGNKYHWLFQNVCLFTKPQTPIRQYVSAVSIIATLQNISGDLGVVMDLAQNLRTALQWEGAWDDKPIGVLTYRDSDCWFSVFGLNGWCLPRILKGKNGYLVRVSIGFAVRLFISRVYHSVSKESFGEEPLYQPLMDEMRLLLDLLQTRYPGGVPPATVLGGFRQKEKDVSLRPRPRTFFILSTEHPTLLSIEGFGNEPKLVLRGKTLPSGLINKTGIREVEHHEPFADHLPFLDYKTERYVAFEKHITKVLKDAGRSNLVCDKTCQGIHWQDKNCRYLTSIDERGKIWYPLIQIKDQEHLNNDMFFDISDLNKKVVSKNTFMQKLAKWAESSSD